MPKIPTPQVTTRSEASIVLSIWRVWADVNLSNRIPGKYGEAHVATSLAAQTCCPRISPSEPRCIYSGFPCNRAIYQSLLERRNGGDCGQFPSTSGLINGRITAILVEGFLWWLSVESPGRVSQGQWLTRSLRNSIMRIWWQVWQCRPYPLRNHHRQFRLPTRSLTRLRGRDLRPIHPAPARKFQASRSLDGEGGAIQSRKSKAAGQRRRTPSLKSEAEANVIIYIFTHFLLSVGLSIDFMGQHRRIRLVLCFKTDFDIRGACQICPCLS